MEIQIRFGKGQKVDALFNGFQVKTDQPIDSGGDGTAPEPFSLFLSSIGTCTGIYVLRFCQQRKINTDDISIGMHVAWNKEKKLIDTIDFTIKTGKDFPDKYKKAVISAAKLCTVKRVLEDPPNINITVIKD
jgi:putative redox protein